MLKEKTKNIIKCLENLHCAYLIRLQDTRYNLRVVMMKITEEEEDNLSKGITLVLPDKNDKSFVVNPSLCLAYGKLDLSPNSKDVITIRNSNWFEKFYIKHYVPMDYNYETNKIETYNKKGIYLETTDECKYIPFLYASINKPERVVIFKEYIDPLYDKKLRHKESAKKYNQKPTTIAKVKKKKAIKKQQKLSMLTFNIKK